MVNIHYGSQLLLVYHRVLNWALFSFLIYINYLTKDISATNKLFADNTSIFFYYKLYWCFWTKVGQWSEGNIHLDLLCKMSFNPDVSKQAQKVILSKKFKHCSTQLFNLITFLHNVSPFINKTFRSLSRWKTQL